MADLVDDDGLKIEPIPVPQQPTALNAAFKAVVAGTMRHRDGALALRL